MAKKLVIGSVLVLAVAYYLGAFKSGPRIGKIVEIKTGKIQGIISKSRDGRDFYEWLGIPYAKPPVGQLRYASPVPAERWVGVKDATKYGPQCAQLEMMTGRIIGDEDCLFVNVHVPKLASGDELPKGLPIMVFIHGGGFNHGSSAEYRPDYFMDQDVILVTMNYRLGSFGFLSTGDGVVRGNMGLKDQALALKWVQENIQAFGGDPKQVTIFGESAGGASVHYQLLSPSTGGLFSKAIAQSGVGSALFGFDSPEVTKQLTKSLADSVGCDHADSVKLVECLRSVSAQDLLSASMEDTNFNTLVKPQMDGHPFRPTIEAVKDDEAFITEHPLAIVAKGKAHRVPCLMGVTADEGLLSSIEFYRNATAMATFESDWDTGIARMFGIPKTDKRLPEIASKIRQFYFPQGLSALTAEEKWKTYTKIFSDSVFNFHLSETVKMQREFSPIYLYHFNFHGGPSLATMLAEITGTLPLMLEAALIIGKLTVNYYVFGEKPKDYGVCHADDLAMLFLMPGMFTVSKNEENPDYSRLYHFSKDMVKLWTDFASSRDGTDLEFRGAKLEPAKRKGRLEYFDISEDPKMIPEPFEERINYLKTLNYLQVS